MSGASPKSSCCLQSSDFNFSAGCEEGLSIMCHLVMFKLYGPFKNVGHVKLEQKDGVRVSDWVRWTGISVQILLHNI